MYYIADATLDSDSLEHYGVLGMKWGIRRDKKKLAKATTKEDRDEAVSSLTKQREKASKKVSKLESRRTKLEREATRSIEIRDVKAAKLHRKATILNRKAYSRFTSTKRAQRLWYRSVRLETKASKLEARSAQAKKAVHKNERLIKTFNQGISEIDAALITAGKKYVKGS